MIIAKAKGKKGDLVILGLSEKNILKMKDGHPIFRKIPETNIEVLIMYGETEGAIYRDLEKGGIKMPIPEIRGK